MLEAQVAYCEHAMARHKPPSRNTCNVSILVKTRSFSEPKAPLEPLSPPKLSSLSTNRRLGSQACLVAFLFNVIPRQSPKFTAKHGSFDLQVRFVEPPWVYLEKNGFPATTRAG